jgi:hypothetical protein
MSGQIFISYRREESRWSAGRLYDRLCAHFDRKQIFMDIDAMEDFVRREIATALKRDIRVIPVLVDGALMPRSTELPEDLKPLVRRNALRVSDIGFDDDCRRLMAAIEQVLEAAERREREEKERLEAERRDTEAKARLEAERQQKEEQDRLETERRATEAKERLEAERRQKEQQERLEHEPQSPPPGPVTPSRSPGKRKLRPVVGIVMLLALVIGLAVGAVIYFGSPRPSPKSTTPEPMAQPSVSPSTLVAAITPSPAKAFVSPGAK